MSSDKVTYILGAGASCKSQPLVFDMKDRMLALLELLNPKSNLHNDYILPELKGKTMRIYNKYNKVIQESVKHHTPDTYAKKLHLTRQKDNLELFKEFLNLYFLFEQDFSKDAYSSFPENPYKIEPKIIGLGEDKRIDLKNESETRDTLLMDRTKGEKTWKSIETPIDYRYDVFYATLLEAFGNDRLTLPSNVNILSWNYDNQLELAYKDYENMDMNSIKSQLNINPKTYDEYKSHIVKLNGTCNLMHRDEDDEVKELDFIKAIQLLKEDTSLQNEIEFAWESKSKNWGVINSIILKTNKLVIIGYSFPNFNKDIDTLILHYLPKGNCQIFIQVPEDEEYTRIKERILQRGILLKSEKIVHKKDRDQFFIPI